MAGFLLTYPQYLQQKCVFLNIFHEFWRGKNASYIDINVRICIFRTSQPAHLELIAELLAPCDPRGSIWWGPAFTSSFFFIGFGRSERKYSFSAFGNTKNQLLRIFLNFWRYGSSCCSTELSNTCKIRISKKSVQLRIQLALGSKMEMSARDLVKADEILHRNSQNVQSPGT